MTLYSIGKLPASDLAKLLARYAPSDPRLLLGAAVGEDAAVIDMGDRYLVAATDPITFATDQIGWYAVNINANDIACIGAVPRWFLAAILLPENHTTPELVDTIYNQIYTACTELNITLAGGHTEITYGLERPLVIGQMLGEVIPGKMVRTGGAQIDDELILTKGIAVEGTAIIAIEKRELLLDGVGVDNLNDYANFLHDPGISVVREALLAVDNGGVHAMHDPTEGGIAAGLHELAEAAGVGLEIFEEQLPILPETRRLCQYFDLDPLGLIASGALLIAVEPQAAQSLLDRLRQAGIKASRIGRVQPAQQGRLLVGSQGARPLPTFARDEITVLFE